MAKASRSGDDLPLPFDVAIRDHVGNVQFDVEAKTRAGQLRRWEHKVVGQLLRYYHLENLAPAMSNLSRERTGIRRLTMEAFRLEQPSFPLWLTAQFVPHVHKVTIQHVVKDLTKTNLFRAFAASEETVPDTYRSLQVGLVFPWLKVWPMAIIHDCGHRLMSPGAAIFVRFAGNEDQLLAIQSFDSFLASLPWLPTIRRH